MSKVLKVIIGLVVLFFVMVACTAALGGSDTTDTTETVTATEESAEEPEAAEKPKEKAEPSPEPEKTRLTKAERKENRELAFLMTVRSGIPSLEDIPEGVLIQEAKGVCRVYRNGPVTPESILLGAQTFSENTDGAMSIEDGAYFIGASAAMYCPAVSREINEALN